MIKTKGNNHMKPSALYSVVIIISVITLSLSTVGALPAQAAAITAFRNVNSNNAGVQVGGMPLPNGDTQTLIVAQVNVETAIGNYKDFPLLTINNNTAITGINFSSFYYTFYNSPQIDNVSYSATGGTCYQSGNTVNCSGSITAFYVSYTYYANAEALNDILSITEDFSSSGFSFNGVFTTEYQPRLLKYKSSSTPVQIISARSYRWQTSNSVTYATNTISFDLSCVLINYQASNFRGLTIANVDFISNLNKINQAAIDSKVLVRISGINGSTFRIDGTYVPGAVVPPAKKSSHLVGHAIDMNVLYGAGYSHACNSSCLMSAKRPQPVTDFINAVKAAGMRWGGDFQKIDPVHFDDNYYYASPTKYAEQFKLAQSNPSCRLGYSLNP